MLIVAWKHGVMSQQKKIIAPQKDITVYNCCTANLRQVTMKEMVDIGKDISKDAPFDKLGKNCNDYFINFKIQIIFILL